MPQVMKPPFQKVDTHPKLPEKNLLLPLVGRTVEVEVLSDGLVISGKLVDLDRYHLCLEDESGRRFLLFKHALTSVRAVAK